MYSVVRRIIGNSVKSSAAPHLLGTRIPLASYLRVETPQRCRALCLPLQCRAVGQQRGHRSVSYTQDTGHYERARTGDIGFTDVNTVRGAFNIFLSVHFNAGTSSTYFALFLLM